MDVTGYYIEKESLGGLLGEAADGSSQLPDFQRGWVWDDDRIRSLLASISLGYPIGAVMRLRAGGIVSASSSVPSRVRRRRSSGTLSDSSSTDSSG